MVSDVSVINCNHVLKPETVNVPDSLWFPPTIEGPHGYQFRVAEMDLNKQNKPACIYLYFSLMT